MARPDDGIFGQCHQAPDGCPQGGTVAAGQIGAAAVAHEEGVAGKKMAFGIQADSAGGVAGCVDHLDGQLTDLEPVAVGQKAVGPNAAGVGGVDQDPGTGPGLECRVARRVVAVTMGVEDDFDAQTFAAGRRQYLVDIAAGVDHHRFAGFSAPDQIAEIVHSADFELPDDHGGSLHLQLAWFACKRVCMPR